MIMGSQLDGLLSHWQPAFANKLMMKYLYSYGSAVSQTSSAVFYVYVFIHQNHLPAVMYCRVAEPSAAEGAAEEPQGEAQAPRTRRRRRVSWGIERGYSHPQPARGPGEAW